MDQLKRFEVIALLCFYFGLFIRTRTIGAISDGRLARKGRLVIRAVALPVLSLRRLVQLAHRFRVRILLGSQKHDLLKLDLDDLHLSLLLFKLLLNKRHAQQLSLFLVRGHACLVHFATLVIAHGLYPGAE